MTGYNTSGSVVVVVLAVVTVVDVVTVVVVVAGGEPGDGSHAWVSVLQ